MRQPRLAAAVAAVVLGLSLSSCAGDETEPAAAEADETPTAPSSPVSATTTTSEPTATLSASPSEPSATPSATEEPSATLTSEPAQPPPSPDAATMLLPAERMGKLNAEWTWAAGNDFDREPARLTVCHRTDLATIGAEQVAVREYTSALDARVRAYHVVAGFADDVTARRAHAVLQSWRDDCGRRSSVKVSPADRVGSPAEAAWSYDVFRPSPAGSRIENVGIAHDDRVIDLVVVKVEGDDFNYPRGRTPAAIGIRNATDRSG